MDADNIQKEDKAGQNILSTLTDDWFFSYMYKNQKYIYGKFLWSIEA